jgi:hypothetical protein
MELQEYVVEALTRKCGDTSGVLVEPGQILKGETTPGGAELFEFICPPGKLWNVRVILEITETDV